MPQLRRCEHCQAINPPRSPACIACGASLKPKRLGQIEIEAELRRIEHLKETESLRRMTYNGSDRVG
jgi:hypothetical protein